VIAAIELRPWLMAWEFWILEALLAAFVVTTVLALPRLLRALGVTARWWSAVAGLAVVAAVTVWAAPTTNRIYYDEHIYQNVAHNLADLHRAQMCNHGIVEYGRLECLAAEYNKEPYGYPHLLGLAYRIFGVSESLAHLANRLLHVLMVVVAAVGAVRWFGDPRTGLLAGLFLTILPEQLRWSATAAAETPAAFFALVAVVAAVEFSRSRSNVALAWTVCASAWAVQFRPESGLVLLVVGAIVLLGAPGELRRRRIWLAALVGVVLLAGYGVHMIAVRHEGWGAAAAPFALAYFPRNLSVNGWFYFWDDRFPGWVGVLAAIGAIAGQAPLRARLITLLYFGVFFTIFLFFYAGSYNYGADVRYSLMTYAPVVLLAALGGTAVLDRLPTAVAARPALSAGLVAVTVGWWFTWQLPHVRSEGEEAWAARADVRFAEAVARELPRDALVLTHDPNMFLLWGRNAAQLSFAASPGFRDHAARRHGGGVFIHWGFWCNVTDPVQHQICQDALDAGPVTLVREYTERDYRYAFYRAGE
jgi:hypothetical protein